MAAERARTGRALIIAYDHNSFSPLQLAKEIDGLADIVWVVAPGDEMLGPLRELLPRLGRVVEQRGSIEALVRELALERPAGLVTFSHSQLLRAAVLARALGLAFSPPEAIARCIDKWEQRQAYRRAGLPGPLITPLVVGENPTALDDLAGSPFPAVLKPRAGAGSLDTHLVDDLAALARLVHGPEQVSPGAYVLEGYLAGAETRADTGVADYVSVESVISAGAVTHCGITGKFPLASGFRETGNFVPSGLGAREQHEVLACASAAIAALGLSAGCVHTEIKLTDAGARLIELNPRVAGGGISDLYDMQRGTSLIRLAALAALGEPVPAASADSGVAYQVFVPPPAGARQLLGLDGIADVAALPGVEEIYVNRPAGSLVDAGEGSLGYVAFVRGRATDHPAMLERREEIVARVQPRYAPVPTTPLVGAGGTEKPVP